MNNTPFCMYLYVFIIGNTYKVNLQFGRHLGFLLYLAHENLSLHAQKLTSMLKVFFTQQKNCILHVVHRLTIVDSSGCALSHIISDTISNILVCPTMPRCYQTESKSFVLVLLWVKWNNNTKHPILHLSTCSHYMDI